jgi:hypothetical protein
VLGGAAPFRILALAGEAPTGSVPDQVAIVQSRPLPMPAVAPARGLDQRADDMLLVAPAVVEESVGFLASSSV